MRFDIARYWYKSSLSLLTILLLPFSWLFRLIVCLRRCAYQYGIFHSEKFNVPVIIVGNITVGGTGKTPFVLALSAWLQAKGYKPGIVSRGVGGKQYRTPYQVTMNDSANEIGDEAMLLRETRCPLVLCIDRPAAVRYLLQKHDCDIVISDDGLQHYRLARDIEIIIIDGERKLGNQQLLPAGPLREPVSRLREVDLVVVNGESVPDEKIYGVIARQMVLIVDNCIAVKSQAKRALAQFAGQRVHAVAGIGHPERFFKLLEKAEIKIIRHTFPDHHRYTASDLAFSDDLPILMTEKDAVKCREFADEHYWYIHVYAKLNSSIFAILEKQISQYKQA